MTIHNARHPLMRASAMWLGAREATTLRRLVIGGCAVFWGLAIVAVIL